MTQARKSLISLSDTQYYHCIARCVRRAFLFGEDSLTGRRYDHRKQWVVARIEALSRMYAIEVCAYAVMSNHYHVVLRVDDEMAQAWDHAQVIERWSQLFSLPVLVERYRLGQAKGAEIMVAQELIESWRARLCDISWYMRCLNERIARMANQEDGCKGRFWEGRFKSQALLDDTAVLACMAYVDLNPVRAGVADELKDSDYTSIQARLRALAAQKRGRPVHKRGESSASAQENPAKLAVNNSQAAVSQVNDMPAAMPELPITLAQYIDLVEWTGRQMRPDKTGRIKQDVTDILARLDIDKKQWLSYVPAIEEGFSEAVGSAQGLQALGEKLQRCWLHGQRMARRLYRADTAMAAAQ